MGGWGITASCKRYGLLVVVAGAACLLGAAPQAVAAAPPAATVSAFPSPGDRVASPQTQLAFRGLAFTRLATAQISVTGSKSGAHTGRLAEDSDGQGGSFLPTTPFTAGETVTVHTSLPIIGGKRGTYTFSVANPAGTIPLAKLTPAKRVSGDVWHFYSDPSLAPTAVKISTSHGGQAPGYVFLSPEAGPISWGPEILDSSGHLIWTEQSPPLDKVNNFQVQTYGGQRVLTWWQGNVNAACGRGVDVIYNSSYQQIATIKAANGQMADLHEFAVTPAGDALITAYYPVYWNATSVHGSTNQIVFDGIVQEIDIKTGLVLFQWDSLDHVPLFVSSAHLPRPGFPYDYFHVNSIELDSQGNFVISSRNTSAVYKVNGHTGAVIWTLGGKHSSFHFGSGATFGFQHDVHVSGQGDENVTMFDDGFGPPFLHRSRGLKLRLNFQKMTATEVASYMLSPPRDATVEGSYQRLPDGHVFIGWGNAPDFSEFTPSGKTLFNGEFVDNNDSYRAFRFQWFGRPRQPPAIAAATSHGHTYVYASWNGATDVASWRVLGGASPTSLVKVASATRANFETQIKAKALQYVAVQALDSKSQDLGQSATIHPS